MKTGIDRLLEDAALRKPLAGRRVALLAHPASVTRNLVHSLDALAALGDIDLSAAFGPQHGLRGDKQDNMVESPDYTDPVHGIPVYSLYGKVRRPTAQMMESFDVLLVDLQDVGCRVYTFVTTLRYVLEAAAKHGKSVWVLDRPNPAGRPVEGLKLRAGWESFVGVGPLPMRHGLTLGELARWLVRTLRLNAACEVVTMEGWDPDGAHGHGWPLTHRHALPVGWALLPARRARHRPDAAGVLGGSARHRLHDRNVGWPSGRRLLRLRSGHGHRRRRQCATCGGDAGSASATQGGRAVDRRLRGRRDRSVQGHLLRRQPLRRHRRGDVTTNIAWHTRTQSS